MQVSGFEASQCYDLIGYVSSAEAGVLFMPYYPGVSQALTQAACPGRCVIFFLPINSCRETEKLYKTVLRLSFNINGAPFKENAEALGR